MSKIAVPMVLSYTVEINIDARGDVHFKANRKIEAIEFMQHLQQVQNTILNHFLTARAQMMKTGLQIPPHEFTGDDNGICTVCGKAENASQHVVRAS